MIEQLPLTADELLTTTRTVRKRLDFNRPVERETILECLAIAHQAPTACNMQNWHFIVVTDAAKRAELATIYRKGWELYLPMPFSVLNLSFVNASHQAMQSRVGDSAQYLADNIEKVPTLVIPCFTGRVEKESNAIQAAMWGTIAPAAWNFMLAARARGLGTAWTSVHLFCEEEAAGVLGIPYAEITQACLIPVAYTRGTKFKPGWREPLTTTVHWDSW
jgi:nitroreductase